MINGTRPAVPSELLDKRASNAEACAAKRHDKSALRRHERLPWRLRAFQRAGVECAKSWIWGMATESWRDTREFDSVQPLLTGTQELDGMLKMQHRSGLPSIPSARKD